MGSTTRAKGGESGDVVSKWWNARAQELSQCQAHEDGGGQSVDVSDPALTLEELLQAPPEGSEPEPELPLEEIQARRAGSFSSDRFLLLCTARSQPESTAPGRGRFWAAMRIPQPARDLQAGETTVKEKPLDVPELLKAASTSGVSSPGSVRIGVPSVQVAVPPVPAAAPPAVPVLMPTMAVTHTSPYGMGMQGMMQTMQPGVWALTAQQQQAHLHGLIGHPYGRMMRAAW